MSVWACTENRRKYNSHKGTTRLRGKPRNRWHDEMREDGQIVGGEGWQEKVHNREEWKKLLRTARNPCILHMPTQPIPNTMQKHTDEKTNESLL